VCNPCGDQYLAGTLGDLKAPGAGSLNVDVEEKPEQSDQEALEIGEGSEPQLEPDRRGGAVKEKAEVHAMAERPPQTNVENIREIPATIITPTSTVAATQTVIEVLNPKSVIPTQTDGVGKESEASPAVELGDGMAPGQQSTPAKQAEAEKMNVDG